MSCGMLSYFWQQPCCFARHWFLTTPSPAAEVAAASEAEVVASMVVADTPGAAAVATLRGVLTQVIQ
jgi:hypothetical protein